MSRPPLPVALLAVAAPSALAGCGEKQEPTGARAQARAVHASMLDYFPNADHAGIYAAQAHGRRSAQAGLDVKIAGAAGPVRAAEAAAAGQADLAISYEPELLLARDQGAEARRRRRARAEAADVADVARPARRHARRSDLARQARRHRRHPVPGGVPEDDPRARRASTPRSVKEINVGFNLVPAMLSRKVDATLGAFWNYEGVELARSSASTRRSSAWSRPACRPTTSWSSSPAQDRSTRTAARSCAASCRRSRAGTQALAQEPGSGRRRAAEGQPGPRPRPAGGERQGDAAGVLPGRRAQAVRLAGPGRVGGLRRAGCATTSCSSSRPTRRAPLTNEFLPGEGLSTALAVAQHRARRACRSPARPAHSP